MNPFKDPLTSVDFDKFLDQPIQQVENMFKDFFGSQFINPKPIKLYRVVRAGKDSDYIFIKAWSRDQAVYFYLLHESKYPDNYLFAEVLSLIKNMGLMSPIEAYTYIIQQMFNTDIPFSDYLIEVNTLSIIEP